jgi:hypothetical protein
VTLWGIQQLMSKEQGSVSKVAVLNTGQPGFDSQQGKYVQTHYEAHPVAWPGPRLAPKDGGIYSFKTLVTSYQTTCCRNPEDCNMTRRSLPHAFYLSVNCSQALVGVSEKGTRSQNARYLFHVSCFRFFKTDWPWRSIIAVMNTSLLRQEAIL